MITVRSTDEVRSFVEEEKKSGKKIGFVPTMGALHEGHLSLVQACKKRGLTCVMSIFVNPTQFGPNEDFGKYPRSLELDQNMALSAGTSLLFTPSVETVYPSETKNWINPPEHLNEVLCGPFRPGHFRGVCTVVHRLLEIVQPDELFLGQKDAQQLRILQESMKLLHPKTEILGIPTLREKSGLAMSSRNKYLSVEEKTKAEIIFKALSAAENSFKAGEKRTKNIIQAAQNILNQEPSFKVQYLQLVQWEDFQKTETVLEKSLLAVAGYFGTTRLIDNIILI